MRLVKSIFIGLFVVFIMTVAFFYLYINKNQEEISLDNVIPVNCHVYFTSNGDDPSIKELEYKVIVKNRSNKIQSFYLLIQRPKADWYPFLTSIPEKYYTELLTIQPNDIEHYDIKTSYKSEDTDVSGGNLGDFTVKVLSQSEFEELK